MKNKKITMIAYFGKEKMGAGVFMENLYPLLLKRLVQDRYEVTLITNTYFIQSMENKIPPGVRIIEPAWLKKAVFAKFFFLFIFPVKDYAKNADLIYFSADAVIGNGLKNVAATVHDLNEFEVLNKHGLIQNWFRKKMIGRVMKRAAAILVPSCFTRSQIGRFFPRYKNDKRISVIFHSGITIPTYNDNKFQAEKSPYFLITGRIDPHGKKLYEAVKIFTYYYEVHNEFKLILAGGIDKFCRESAEIFLGEISGRKEIEYAGYVSDEKLDFLYRNAYAVIFFSELEGFGLSGLESFGRGCPVITNAKNEVNNELLMNMDIKIFSEELDNKAIVLDKLKKIESINKNKLINIARQFTREKMVEKYFEILKAHI